MKWYVGRSLSLPQFCFHWFITCTNFSTSSASFFMPNFIASSCDRSWRGCRKLPIFLLNVAMYSSNSVWKKHVQNSYTITFSGYNSIIRIFWLLSYLGNIAHRRNASGMHNATTIWHFIFIGIFWVIVIINRMNNAQVKKQSIKNLLQSRN